MDKTAAPGGDSGAFRPKRWSSTG